MQQEIAAPAEAMCASLVEQVQPVGNRPMFELSDIHNLQKHRCPEAATPAL
jgi:hypothetical protein